jgi:hypothetical protein
MNEFDIIKIDPDLGGEQIVYRLAGHGDATIWATVHRAKPVTVDIATKHGDSKSQMHAVEIVVSTTDVPSVTIQATQFILYRNIGDASTTIMYAGALLRQTRDYFRIGLTG